VREPFKAGFHNFFRVSFFSSEWHVAEEVFHETCVAVLDEGFFDFRYVFVA